MRSIDEIVRLTDAKKSGSGWVARCKAHDDRSPSLSIAQGSDGRILLHCHTGCTAEAVMLSLGLEWGDVSPEKKRLVGHETTWEIRDADGKLIAEHIRIDEGGKKRFVWRRSGGSGLAGMPVRDVPLYRSEHANSFDPKKAIVLCEGEKAADAAARIGLQSLGTVCGSSATPGRGPLSVLNDRAVILWPDFDEPGIEHMVRIAEALRGAARSVRWIHQPAAESKCDAADYAGTREALRPAVSDEPPTLSTPLVMMADAVNDATRELAKFHSGDLSDYVSTGIASLDRKLGGGFRRGQMILLGAATGAGKTSLVAQFAMTAQDTGLAIIVSPEMSTRELTIREIVRRAQRPKWHRAPWAFEPTREDAKMLHDMAAESIATQRPTVAVYDAINVRMEDVLVAARAAHKKIPLSFIALDYAQQLADETSRKARHLLVGDVGHRALEMAREFNCPVVVTSQVNVFKDGQTKSYSFRESQILEHKAHLVLLFHVERDERGHVTKAIFKAQKARDLGLFELEVSFDPATFSIEPLDKDAEPQIRDWTGSA